MAPQKESIDPAKASSALGEAILLLQEATGVELEFGAFLAIDGIAKTLQSLQAQLIRLQATRLDMADDIGAINSRLSTLEENFSNLYDSIPIADRPDLDSVVDTSFS